MKNGNHRRHFTRLNSLVFISTFIIAVTVVAVPFYSARSSSVPGRNSSPASASSTATKSLNPAAAALAPRASTTELFLPVPVSSPEAIYTFASDCTTPKTDWNLGETVCAKANGVPVTLFPWRVLLVDPAGFVRNSQDAIADDNATYTFPLPSSPTTTVNGQIVDNRGSWRVELVKSNGALRQSAVITVHEPANPVADVFVQKTVRDGDATVSVGGSIAFLLVVANAGPDSALSVNLIDSTPSGSSLVSLTQQSGPSCLPALSSNCTIATLANGERAEFTAIYLIGGSPGDVLTTATVSSPTTDSNSDNNSSTAQFTVATGGTTSQCTLLCPTSITYSEDSPGSGGKTVAANAFPVPTTTGTCGAVSTSAVPNPQTNNYFFPVGISVITASTESGEECAFTVTVTDNQNPTISCPGDIATFESSPGSGSAIVNFNVTASDNSGVANITCTHQSGDTFATGAPTQVTCTATDDSNNTATCSFNVTVNAINSTCVLTTVPPIVVDSPDNACGANVTFTTPTSNGSGTCGTISCDHASGSFFPAGETLVTCTSSPDGASTSFTVTVNDVTAPVPTLSSLPTLSETCSVTAGVPTTIQTPTGPKVVIELPTATDNCGGLISGSTNDERTYTDPGSHVVTWNYTDAAGNTVSQTQTVIVTGTDTAAPVPDVTNLPTVTDECEVTLTPPTATDNCAGTVTGTTANLTIVGAGTHTVTWTYTDGVGNSSTQTQTVVVTDVHAPTIALVGPSSVTIECHTSFDDPGVTTEDNCLPKNVQVTVTGLPNVDQPGTYSVMYTATDGGGNQASTQRTVIVQDTIKPVITLNGGNMTVECHTSFTDPGASASDTCDTDVPVNVSGAVDINTPGTYVLTYNAADDSGNQADSVQRTVTVVDTTPPVITLNGQTPSMWPPNHDYHTFQVTDFVTAVTDSCDTNLGISGVVIEKVTSDESEDADADGSTLNDIVIAADCKSVQLRSERSGAHDGRVYTITFRVRDASGNTTTATAKVVVPHNTGETPVDSGVHYTVNGTCP